jgi:hypothetical protein
MWARSLATASPRPYIATAMRIYLIDPPGPFDTLATWERHLAYVRSLPPDTLLRAELIQDAEEAIALIGVGRRTLH